MKNVLLHFTFVSIVLLFFCNFLPAKKVHAENSFTSDTEFLNLPAAKKDVPKYGEDSLTCLKNLSMYVLDFRHRNYQGAYRAWRWVFENCPAASMNIYIHGAALIKQLYINETDEARQNALLDTLMMVYSQRLEYFGHDPRSREGVVMSHKVIDLYQYRPDAAHDHYRISERSIELEGNESQAAVIFINFQATIRLAEAGLLDQTKIVENYNRAIDIIEYNLAHNPADSSKFSSASNNIELLFEPYASCQNLVKVFQPRFESNAEDLDLLKRITSIMNGSGCTEDDLFYQATNKLHHLQPTAGSAFLMGQMENSRQNFSQALNYFQQAADLYEEPQEKFTAYLLMSSIAYQQQRRFPQARTYALKAAEVRPEDGRPFMLIAEMYALSARECGDNDLTQKTAYWVAVDKLNQAKNLNLDPLARERTELLINNFSQHFPSIDDVFFNGLSEGDRYRVECWINENTTVRARR
jgi:tetratricopeptide (TPR) repeat protein